MKENHVWMIKEKMLEVIEALETINFVKGEPTKTTKIRMNLDISMREKNIAFLKENLDVFVWSHEDMLGIPTAIIQHHLNVNPERKPVQQRRKVFTPERSKAIMDKVDKLLAANFIWEGYYLE